MTKPTGGPAFPRPSTAIREDDLPLHSIDGGDEGMTLRDYFAAQAVLGLMQAAIAAAAAGHPDHDVEDMAKGAYEIADALLLERDK